MIAGFMQATPIAGQFEAMPGGQQEAFIKRVSERLGDYIDDTGLAAPKENHFLKATR